MFHERAAVADDECFHSTRPSQIWMCFQELACFSSSLVHLSPGITMNSKIAIFINGVECRRPFFWMILAENRQNGVRPCLLLVENSDQVVEVCSPSPFKGRKRIIGWNWLFPTHTQHKYLIGQVQQMWLAKKSRICLVRVFILSRFSCNFSISPCNFSCDSFTSFRSRFNIFISSLWMTNSW